MFKQNILLLTITATALAQKSKIGTLYSDLNCQNPVDNVEIDDSGFLPQNPNVNPLSVKMNDNEAAYIWSRKETGQGNACRDQHELAPALQCHHFANKAVIRCLSRSLNDAQVGSSA